MKKLFAILATTILLSFIGNVNAEFLSQPCRDCLIINDEKTLENYKKTLPLVIWAENLNPGNTVIELKGQSNIGISSIPITITVVNPIGNLVTVDQITANADGSFATDIRTGGQMWKQDGTYIIKAQQGEKVNTNKIAKIQVDIVNGAVVPEFGPVAMLVLVAAVSSIVLFTTRGRFSTLTKI